jgi:hypothetical protein
MIFRVIGLMSGLQKRLDSRVNMFDTIAPYAEREAQVFDRLAGEAAG